MHFHACLAFSPDLLFFAGSLCQKKEKVNGVDGKYVMKGIPANFVFSLVSLGLVEEDGQEKVIYHKDMWNEKVCKPVGGLFEMKLKCE